LVMAARCGRIASDVATVSGLARDGSVGRSREEDASRVERRWRARAGFAS
jgi:hypothetical protein